MSCFEETRTKRSRSLSAPPEEQGSFFAAWWRAAATFAFFQNKIICFIVFAAICSSARADSIAVTYSLTGVGTVTDASPPTLTLIAQANGSLLSSNAGLNAGWNPVSYSDQSVLDLTTGLLNGTFVLSLANGDTLTGNLFEDQSAIVASPTQTGSFPQTLTFTGGTGAFARATGSVSGKGFLGTTDFTVSGSGTVNTPEVPEPGSATLLLGGLAFVLAGTRRAIKVRR